MIALKTRNQRSRLCFRRIFTADPSFLLPQPSPCPFPPWLPHPPPVRAFQAHRGAPGLPENSVQSIVAALENPAYSAVEIDIYRLADGAYALHHDPLPGRVITGVRSAPLYS